MNTTHIANGHDTRVSITDELDLIEAWLDCDHDHQRYFNPGYAMALEGAMRALIQHVRQQQPVVDAARDFAATRVGGGAFDREFRQLIQRVRTYEEMQS